MRNLFKVTGSMLVFGVVSMFGLTLVADGLAALVCFFWLA